MSFRSGLSVTLFGALLLAPAGELGAAPQGELEFAGLREAWKVTRGAGVAIAYLNTGINYHLAEFRGRILRGADGSFGFDAVSDRHDPMDLLEFGLGTQLGSIIAGNRFGVAPEAQLVPVRVFDENGAGSHLSLEKGVRYAISRGVRILELGGGPLDLGRDGTALCEALQAAEAAGILLVFPVGNSGEELPEYPIGCALSSALNVAGADQRGELSRYSGFGFPAVHVAALSEGLHRVSRDGTVRTDGKGNSFASAFAAGVAALVWSAHPRYRAADVRTALIRGALPRASLQGKVLANGVLNAALAIGADVSRPE